MTIPYLDLTPDQQALLKRLEALGHHLVTGIPGSGKSLLAVHQAAMLELCGRPTTLLAHSNLLRQRLQADATALGSSVEIKTYHAWIHEWHREITGRPLERSGSLQFDWPALIAAALRNPILLNRTLVVDEGQDLPQEFYQLCRLIGVQLIVFADEYQRIKDEQSTLAEIGTALGEHTGHDLDVNLRNPRPIAELALHFHVGLRPPPLPGRDGRRPVLLHRPDNPRPFVRWLTHYAATNRKISIGVIVKHTAGQQRLLAEVERTQLGLRPQIYVGSAQTERHRTVDFARPGLRIVNRASAKGLEFDTVIIPDTHLDSGDPTMAALRMMYYVLVTRTRDRLYLCYAGDLEPPIFDQISDQLLIRKLLEVR